MDMMLPRQYFQDANLVQMYKLCGFSDASMRAYAAIVYLKVSEEGSKRVSFVASKTRVAPVKEHKIIRLELLGALLLARLINSITLAYEEKIQLTTPI